jgi:hypothetical protein
VGTHGPWVRPQRPLRNHRRGGSVGLAILAAKDSMLRARQRKQGVLILVCTAGSLRLQREMLNAAQKCSNGRRAPAPNESCRGRAPGLPGLPH